MMLVLVWILVDLVDQGQVPRVRTLIHLISGWILIRHRLLQGRRHLPILDLERPPIQLVWMWN